MSANMLPALDASSLFQAYDRLAVDDAADFPEERQQSEPGRSRRQIAYAILFFGGLLASYFHLGVAIVSLVSIFGAVVLTACIKELWRTLPALVGSSEMPVPA